MIPGTQDRAAGAENRQPAAEKEPPQARKPLRLDHNERLFPAPELVRALSRVPGRALVQYPDARDLEARIAARWSIDPSRVLVTAGGDDAIDRACRLFLAGRPHLVGVVPTFEMFPYFAGLAGGRMVEVPGLEDPLPVEALLAAADDRAGLVVVISPHNPTGIAAPTSRLLELADALPPRCTLLADLAYVEFAGEDPTPRLLERGNALIVRTLSKAWGLAGLRVGYALGSPEVVKSLRTSGPPFPLAGPSLWVAERALDLGSRVIASYVDTVRAERRELAGALRRLGADPFPSEANFVLARWRRAFVIRRRLAERGIRVRTFDDLPDLIRITLPGDDATFRRLLSTLENAALPGDDDAG